MVMAPMVLSPGINQVIQSIFVLLAIGVTFWTVRSNGIWRARSFLLLTGMCLVLAELLLDFADLSQPWLGYVGAFALIFSHIRNLFTCRVCHQDHNH